jgi:hypothetical protein
VVLLLGGDGVEGKVDLWQGFHDDTRGVTHKMVQALNLAAYEGSVPIAGGYGYGQLARFGPNQKGTRPLSSVPQFLNQHIEVVVIGDPGQ